jgi:hypothetical protein
MRENGVRSLLIGTTSHLQTPAAIVLAAVASLCAFSMTALADCDLDNLIGYTMVDSKTIDGYIEHGKRNGDFEGCDFDRIIVFDDNNGVRCTSYNYSYSYRPTAYIFFQGRGFMKMCVEGELYDIAPIR